MTLDAYNEDGPSEDDEDLYEWMNWARRGATCSISAMFLNVLEKPIQNWEMNCFEGNLHSLSVFKGVCKARESLMRMCRLPMVVALETWRREVADDSTWRRFDWDIWRRFYWVFEFKGKRRKGFLSAWIV